MGAWLAKTQAVHRNTADEKIATHQIIQTHTTGKEIATALSGIERMVEITNELIERLCLDKCNLPLAGIR